MNKKKKSFDVEGYLKKEAEKLTKIKPLVDSLDEEIIPETFIVDDSKSLDDDDLEWLYGDRDRLPVELNMAMQERGMYASVTKNLCRAIADWGKNKKFLDVMAGRGWLVKGLREAGLNVHGTDDFSWGNARNWQTLSDIDIENLDAVKSIEKYGKSYDVIILSWPPYGDNIAFKVVEKLHEVNPDAVILYIGENEGGCTADDEFFRSVDVIDDVDFEHVYFAYETIYSLHDKPYLLKYILGDEK